MLATRRFFVFKNFIKKFSTDINIVTSKGKKVEIPRITLQEYLWRNLEKWPNKTAITCFETQRSYTYHELYKKSLSLTRFLKKSLKFETGNAVGVILPNIPEYPIVLLGAVQAGLKVTTCNPNYTSHEIRNQLEISQSRLVFTTTSLVPVVQKALADVTRKVQIVAIPDGVNRSMGGTIDFHEISSGEPGSPVDIDVDETVLLPFSSGTTGLPKGVQLTHYNIVANLCQNTAPEFAFIEGEDVVPAFLPFFHIYGLVMIMLHGIAKGAQVISMPAFSSENFIKLLKNFKPTVIYSVPLVVIMATNNPIIKTEDLACVKVIMSGAGPLGADDVERFRSKTNNKVNLLQGYGMTETSPLTLLQTWRLENGVKVGGSGLLIPNTDAKIIPTDGSDTTGLGPNQSGELLIRGPQVMKGYSNSPEANKEVLLEGGWIKTGDIAHYDEDGHFYVTDRLKELIKVKGFQVAPAELEALLRGYPGVEDAAVVGVPHPSHGEAPKAFIVVKSGETVNLKQLQEFVASKVAKHKHLAGGVVVVGAIPKNPSGKILRRELKKL